MHKTTLSIIVVTLLGLIICSNARCGTEYEVICENKDCGFESNVSFGGGKASDKITGYCVPCKEFVYITWKRNKKPPKSFGQVWDSDTGKEELLYPCHHCGNPFFPIASINNLKYCPRCHKQTLQHTDKITKYD